MSTEICKLAADAGKCSNSLMRYYYDPVLADCQQFVYGGCHGNANRFLTYADCETTCKQALHTAVDVDGNRCSTFRMKYYTLPIHCVTIRNHTAKQNNNVLT